MAAIEARTARQHILQNTSLYAGAIEPQPMKHVWVCAPQDAKDLEQEIQNGLHKDWEFRIHHDEHMGVIFARGPTSNALRVVCNEAFQNALEACDSCVRVVIDGRTVHVYNDIVKEKILPVQTFDCDRFLDSATSLSDADRRELEAIRGQWQPALAFGRPQSGSKFGPERDGIGQYGLGIKLTNVMSESFDVVVSDGEKVWHGQWQRNMETLQGVRVLEISGKRRAMPWKSVTCPSSAVKSLPFVNLCFQMDIKRLDETSLDPYGALYRCMISSLVWDLMAVAREKTKVEFSIVRKAGDTVPKPTPLGLKSFKQYAKSVVEALSPGHGSKMFTVETGETRVAVAPCPSSQAPFVSAFVNGQRCEEGTHVRHVLQAIAKGLQEMAQSQPKKYASLLGKTTQSLSASFVQKNVFLFIDARVPSPTFGDQTKTKLSNRNLGWNLELKPEHIRTLVRGGILDVALAVTEARTAAAKRLEQRREQKDGTPRVSLDGIGSLCPIQYDGYRPAPFTRTPSKRLQCTVLLTEGFSAKDLADAGLGEVDKRFFGVLAMRGKPPNTLSQGWAGIMKNDFLKILTGVLGLRPYTDYGNDAAGRKLLASHLRYGRVMIMADQDHDGDHIVGLVLAFFEALGIDFVRQADAVSPFKTFLWRFGTPIVKGDLRVKSSSGASSSKAGGRKRSRKNQGGERDETIPLTFMSLVDFENWRESHPAESKRYRFQYLKGLGSSTDADAKRYFRALDEHTLRMTRDADAHDTISKYYDKSQAHARRDLLRSYAERRGDIIDWKSDGVSVTQYLHRAVLPFEFAALIRAIPSLVDGLKQVSQRKVLFAMLKRQAFSKIKVSQAAAMCAEVAEYPHGEVSLENTIVNLAQVHKGTNNINLLVPEGQFGSQNRPRDAHAAARYMYTRVRKDVVNALTRALDDAPILRHELNEDGDGVVEPQVYGYVVPGVLVNGAEGIGCGWKTSIPPFDPSKLVSLSSRLCSDGLASCVEEKFALVTNADNPIPDARGIHDGPHVLSSVLNEVGLRAWEEDERFLKWRVQALCTGPWWSGWLGGMQLRWTNLDDKRAVWAWVEKFKTCAWVEPLRALVESQLTPEDRAGPLVTPRLVPPQEVVLSGRVHVYPHEANPNIIVVVVEELPPGVWTDTWIKWARDKHMASTERTKEKTQNSPASTPRSSSSAARPSRPFILDVQPEYTKTFLRIVLLCDREAIEPLIQRRSPGLPLCERVLDSIERTDCPLLMARAQQWSENGVPPSYPDLEACLKLVQTRSLMHMHVFNSRNQFVRHAGIDTMLMEHMVYKLGMLRTRRAYSVQDLEATRLKVTSQARFIREVNQGTLKIQNVPTKDICIALEKHGYPTDTELAKAKPIPFSRRRITTLTEEDGVEGEELRDEERTSFEYLLRMNVRSLSAEHACRLEEMACDAAQKVEETRHRHEIDMWKEELHELHQCL